MLFNNLFKKKPAVPESFSWLNADMHSHLLPGIDDGSPDMDTTIEFIKGFADLGYKKIITTPHVLWEMYPNTPAIINEKLDAVKRALAEWKIEIEIHAAAEYFIDDYFSGLLRNKTPLLTLKDNQVLVEISTLTAPFDFKEVLFELQMQNYQPVIAHPERYIYLKTNKELFDELKDIGCYFQVNLLSLTGHYGTAVHDLAQWLIKKGYYDYAGTDLHHSKHLQLLSRVASSPLCKTLRESGLIKNHLL